MMSVLCFCQAKNQPVNIIEKPATDSSDLRENIDAEQPFWYTEFAFTHTEDSEMLRSNTSAVRGLARGVIPYGVALYFLWAFKQYSLSLENHAKNLGFVHAI